MGSRSNNRPGTGKFAVAVLDDGPPPHPHADKYALGACDCALCSEWHRRLIAHDHAKKSGETSVIRKTLMDLMVVENIRDLWSELSWAALTEEWEPIWIDWIMEEFADPERSVGWWASQAAHHPMKYWYIRWAVWRKSALGIPENEMIGLAQEDFQ